MNANQNDIEWSVIQYIAKYQAISKWIPQGTTTIKLTLMVQFFEQYYEQPKS